MSYHLTEIEKGVLGTSSKIREEYEELVDAETQGIKIMALVELSDLVGAIEAYLKTNYPGITLVDLAKMSAATSRAFADGSRK